MPPSEKRHCASGERGVDLFASRCQELFDQAEELDFSQASMSPVVQNIASELRRLADKIVPNQTDRFSAEQAADLLGLAPDSVRRYCNRGFLKGEKVGHIWFVPRSEIDRYLRDRQSPGKPRKSR